MSPVTYYPEVEAMSDEELSTEMERVQALVLSTGSPNEEYRTRQAELEAEAQSRFSNRQYPVAAEKPVVEDPAIRRIQGVAQNHPEKDHGDYSETSNFAQSSDDPRIKTFAPTDRDSQVNRFDETAPSYPKEFDEPDKE